MQTEACLNQIDPDTVEAGNNNILQPLMSRDRGLRSHLIFTLLNIASR